MVTSTMMTLIEHNKRVISQLNVASPQTIEKHLGYHDIDCRFFHLVDELFLCCQIGFDSFSLGNCRILATLSVDTDHLVVDIFFSPVQLNVHLA